MMVMKTRPAPSQEDITFQTTLFVEGVYKNLTSAEDDEILSLDPLVLNKLFSRDSATKNVQVQAVGSCESVKGVAKAFHEIKKQWFFIIDRDYNDIDELTWEQFEQGHTNLLIWHKRHLENYFIDPDFLSLLPEGDVFFKKDKNSLVEIIYNNELEMALGKENTKTIY